MRHYIVLNFIAIRWNVAKLWRFNGFQNGGRPPSYIFKKSILKLCYGSENGSASSWKILWWSVKPLRRYGDFSICQNGDRSPSWILEIRNFIGRKG